MGDEPIGDVTHAERRELDALRWRAYGPDADILIDAPALSRLRELEDRVRLERATAQPEQADFVPGAVVVQTALSPARTARGSLSLIATAVVAAVLVAAVAWSGTQSEPMAGPTQTAAVIDRGEVDHEPYVDLRDDALSLPGTEAVANRMMRGQVRPFGILFGRTVAAGRTVDEEFCMIIADLPVSSISCIPVAVANAEPVSVTLPAWYSDSESDLFTGLGELVSYTLLPGGRVIAEPAD